MLKIEVTNNVKDKLTTEYHLHIRLSKMLSSHLIYICPFDPSRRNCTCIILIKSSVNIMCTKISKAHKHRHIERERERERADVYIYQSLCLVALNFSIMK